MELIPVLDFYDDITDRLQGSREILESMMAEGLYTNGGYVPFRKESDYNGDEEQELLNMIWDLHDLHEHETILVRWSW